MRTAQQIFDIVVQHLRKQGERSLSKKGGCAYRGANGLKCAVGVLIPDYKYKASLEQSLCTDPNVMEALPKDTHPHIQMLRKLQATHDMDGPKFWEPKFRDIARSFNLNYKEPKNAKARICHAGEGT